MAKKHDPATLKRVFSDAHVIDVDFSKWDKNISIWVLADHFEIWTTQCPLVVAEFWDVRNLSIEFRHKGVSLSEPAKHVQWWIDDFEIDEATDGISLSLFAGDAQPRIRIECESVKLRRVPTSMLDELFPGWDKPYSGLARPGIEQLFLRK